MENDALTLQSLMNQRDPFAMAQSKQQDQSSFPSAGSAIQGGPGMAPVQTAVSNNNSQSLNNIFQSVSQQPIQDTQILDMFKKMGLNSTGLSLNDVGRYNLTNRLQSQYGPDYMKNPDVKNLMTNFDTYLQQNKNDKGKELTDLNSKAKRTLDMIGQL